MRQYYAGDQTPSFEPRRPVMPSQGPIFTTKGECCLIYGGLGWREANTAAAV